MRYQTNCATIRKQTGAVQWEIDKLLKMLREDGAIGKNKSTQFIEGYETERALDKEEKVYMPIALRWAALRFYISRLEHIHSSPSAEILAIKNPDQFKNILIDRQVTEYRF